MIEVAKIDVYNSPYLKYTDSTGKAVYFKRITEEEYNQLKEEIKDGSDH